MVVQQWHYWKKELVSFDKKSHMAGAENVKIHSLLFSLLHMTFRQIKLDLDTTLDS